MKKAKHGTFRHDVLSIKNLLEYLASTYIPLAQTFSAVLCLCQLLLILNRSPGVK